ncbi:MAG: methylated-DNA--[protein]-cysteine S-methyltransferase [Sphaerochaetaceae bacterium]|jgi:methylated-DNA-[protein]-cysteine S-methyltransferase|nr:methylated-DNA--[protein]-cysteine S-methyltransferase [Sphaerochaetaceae bacterium]MDD3941693.1 methylated-DNA--[protein]-cysteine S-methyltransferase [Sphaerochaetaceae bacterium]MDX9939908.1 methylated-DNA--[protein]-cysteine S-methyltransferase [Sphaerochaetaceae bacterium]
MNTYHEVYETVIGAVMIAESGGAITDVLLLEPHSVCKGEHKATPLTDRAAMQLAQYLAGKRRTFDLPLDPQGTEFQKRVWNALLAIPYGQTCSYKDIAIAIGNPKAVRAVGMANHHNPISFIIPCHRVIGADGSLVGYGGGLELKSRLLGLERAQA